MGVRDLKVLLIGNYPHDRQESMQRFADLMLRELQAGGIDAELMCPTPYFGNLKRSGSGLGKWLGYIDKFLIFPRILRRRLLGLRSQGLTNLVVHICDHSNAFYTKALQGVPHLVTCHDLLAVRSALGEVSENPTRWTGRLLQKSILSGLNGAMRVVCDSQATHADVLRLTHLSVKQVSVVSIALNYPYSPMPPAEAAERLRGLLRVSGRTGLIGRFILHVGGNQWYKNRMGVLRIHAQLVARAKDSPLLIMAGKPLTSEMLAFVEKQKLQDCVVSIESCTNEDLRALYSLAEVFVFPSLAEGFGWPVIEAQACGCPVICSTAGSLKEVAGDSGRGLPAEDELGFVSAIVDMLEPGKRATWVEKGMSNMARFTADRMMKGYLAAYQNLPTPVSAKL